YHGHMHRACREVLIGARQPEASFCRPVHWHLMRDVDDARLRQSPNDAPFHDGHERPLRTEVRRQGDDATGLEHCLLPRLPCQRPSMGEPSAVINAPACSRTRLSLRSADLRGAPDCAAKDEWRMKQRRGTPPAPFMTTTS